MTMDFPVAPTVEGISARIKPGTRVEFTVEKGKNGMYQGPVHNPRQGRGNDGHDARHHPARTAIGQ